jgi:hypothetical protein
MPAVVALNDEIDLVAVAGAPVPHWADVVEPGRLLAQPTTSVCNR